MRWHEQNSSIRSNERSLPYLPHHLTPFFRAAWLLFALVGMRKLLRLGHLSLARQDRVHLTARERGGAFGNRGPIEGED